MVKMIVACLGTDATRFDRAYYVDHHLPLARACWGPHGLEDVDAFFPAGAGDGWMSIGVYRFRDRAAMETALASPDTERVMADVPRFTNAEVRRSVFDPL